MSQTHEIIIEAGAEKSPVDVVMRFDANLSPTTFIAGEFDGILDRGFVVNSSDRRTTLYDLRSGTK